MKITVRKNKNNNKLPLRGIFRCRVYDKGQLIEEFAQNNLIVDTGFELVQQLLSQTAEGKEITQIAFGELTSGDPVEPAADWTDIPNEILIKDVNSATYPSLRSVSFNFEMTGSEGNGSDISYFGLKATDNTLFAAKSRAPISKTADITIEGTWIIHF